MALEKITGIGEMNVGANSVISVRTDTVIKDDGSEISRSFHRHVVVPTDDVSGEDARVQAVANSSITPPQSPNPNTELAIFARWGTAVPMSIPNKISRKSLTTG